MEKQIIKINASEFGLDDTRAQEVESVFLPVVAERDALAETYLQIVDKEMSVELTTDARELRLQLVKVRTNTDRIHKSAKAFYLAGGRFVDAWKNKNVEVITQMEAKLSEIENYYINIEKEKAEKLKAERILILSEYVENPESYPVAAMSDNAFNNLVEGQKLIKKQREEAEKQAELDRIEKEKAEAAERERIRIENEKLKEEAAKREAQILAERKKLEKILADQKAKADAELKAQKEKELAEKKALAAPDKNKIIAFAKQIDALILPEVNSEGAEKILFDAKTLLDKASKLLIDKSETI